MMINKKQMWSDSPFNQWTEEELLCMKYQGICYGKGGGSAPPPPPPATQTVRQSSEFPEELKPFVSDIFGKAQAIQEQRQEEGFRPELTQQLAAFTPDQQAAFTGIREQVGQTRPLFEEATQLTRGATRAATDPAEVAALMNPFLRNVTDIEKREAQRVADVQEQQLAAQAAQAGAFGGSRAAILEAERQRNLAQQLGDIEARGRLAAFQDAQARLQNQFGREAAGAAQLSALGAAIPAQTFKELGALSGIGAAEQQQSQRALDIATQQAREEYGFPMQTLQDFQSILRGFPLPATTNVSRQTFSPAQPLSTQLLGLGTGLAGLAGAAGAFKKAGGLVGAPVAMKNGGYVKLAGGGGLGQLMQGKVKKYAEGGSTQMELISQYTVKELEQLLNNPARVAELGFSPTLVKAELNKKIGARASMQDAARARAQSQFIEGIGKAPGELVEAAKNLPGQLMSLGQSAADATQQGFQAVAPNIPKSGMFADEAAALVDSAKNLIPQGDPRLGMDTAQRIDPTGMKGQTRIPASLLSAPQMAEEIVGSGPQRMMAEEIVTSPAGPSISRLTPATGVPPLPPAAPAPAAIGQASSALSPPSPVGSGATPLTATGSSPVSEPFSLFESQQIGSQNRRSPAAGSSFDITELLPFRSGSPDLLSSQARQQARRGLLTPIEAPDDPALGYADRALTVDLDAAQADADAVRTREKAKAEAAATEAAEPLTGPADGGAAADGTTNKGAPSPGTNSAQIDYNAKIAEFKDKDYSAEIEKALGPAPTYEKGEEPDFASQKYLTLLGVSARILSSNKPALQALGDAVQPAIKELADIGKEERKIQRELRQERNAQKRADYQDKSARLNMQRQLRGDDIDMFTGLARLREQQESNKISAENAETNRNRMLSENAARKVQRLEKEFTFRLEKEGKLSYGDVDKLLDSVLKRSSKAAMVGAKDTLTNLTDPTKIEEVMSAAVQSELPFLLDRIDGRVIGKDGKTVVPRSELMKLIGMKTATAPDGGGKKREIGNVKGAKVLIGR